MNEFLTDFFSSVIEQAAKMEANLIKPYRKDVIDLFNVDNFFQMSMLNLKNWSKIMQHFIDGKPDEMFNQQMNEWNAQGGIFESASALTTRRCYAMKRIAFLIFSCADDEFLNQLDPLMKKMIDVIKKREGKGDIKQRIFVFFLTRVMLIRLNTQTLTEALRKLWPHLLNELISVFEMRSDAEQQQQALDQESSKLTIEAIKLVELLSSLNIEDFQMNQWIFLIDGYGMKRETSMGLGSPERAGEAAVRRAIASPEKQGRDPQPAANAETFKTFIVHFMGDDEWSFYNVKEEQSAAMEMKQQEQELASASPSSTMMQMDDQ